MFVNTHFLTKEEIEAKFRDSESMPLWYFSPVALFGVLLIILLLKVTQ